MISRRQITQAEAEQAMAHGEFGPELLSCAPNVAVVLTQDWCGQWALMDRYLRELAALAERAEGAQRATAAKSPAGPPGLPELCVAVLLYNRVPYFREFLRLKERVWGNALIPYVRYYRQGGLVAQSNYVSAEEFLSHFRP